MTQLQFNDIYGYFRKKNDHGLPQWLESDETVASPDQVQLRVRNRDITDRFSNYDRARKKCTTSANAWRVLKSNWGTLKDLLDVDFVSNWIIKDEFREFCARRFDLHFATAIGMIEFTCIG